MSAQSDLQAAFAADFESALPRLAGSGAAWLAELRRRAMAEFAERGVPTVRNEDWKYTNILPALRGGLEPVLPDDAAIDASRIATVLDACPGIDADSPLLVFVDGVFHRAASRLDGAGVAPGARLAGLRETLERDPDRLEGRLGKYLPTAAHGFAALNTAFLDDGAVIEIDAGTACPTPIHVVYLSTRRERAYVTHPRSLVVAGAGSSAVVVEHFVGDEGARYLTNAGLEIALGRGAALGHLRIQRETETAAHVARVQVEQETASSLVSHAFGLGAAISRTELAIRLGGEEAECKLSGLYVMDGSRHADHHIAIDHACPRTRSDQLYKGVLGDSSRGVFTGRVLVRPASQKIRALQKNPTLLLGSGAVAETRPQLEIYADDVVCNHGATVGRLSEDAMFYLRARGIDPVEARRLLVAGFAAEVFDSVAPEALREALKSRFVPGLL